MYFNGFDIPENAGKALADGKCDLIGIGRGLIADPEWPRKVLDGRENEIIRCLQCDEGCYGNITKGLPVSCVQQ